MELKLLFCFMVVLYLFMVPNWCYAARSMSSKNKHAIKSIKSPDGDIIDCVHISRQPAFDHPLLKNHTIKMRPSYHPNGMKDDNITSLKEKTITQLWHSNGKCPKGTIPIVRTNKEDVLIHGKKKSFPFANRSSLNSELKSVTKGHEYATAATTGVFHGTKATFNLWNPRVQENNEFSLTQLWISGGSDSNLNTIEAGWQVYPSLYHDTNTNLFIFWTRDDYQTGCYNLCPGFVQTNNEFAIGGSLSPTSQVGGSQHDISILIWKDPKDGNWWMQLGDNNVIGYWPASLFTYLSQSASMVMWGGEVVNLHVNNRHTTTQMGSGHFPVEGYGKASYIKNIQIVDESNTLKTPQDLMLYTPQKSCYDIINDANDDWGNYIFYGGPGQNPNCP